ncbi:MoxR family ATPase [Cellulophaga sp. E16_2]|uniref:ATPase associated with various cellular activities AAA_3 n=1 Tax=Cellulophaga algicola (strain DSM 14237 / IC166 / ACAM 630) TaxID=688270 RepID=E6XCY6_CELAD|nr:MULTISPECIES: MoxR family ATPase [Cellulophaga]ADV50127.1 ATPase associated with various cellular activities AAA_3 [Cellulophaga algicola DSM 14237]MBO0592513.1 MoxR family ATPase [Cellulophaga sp. E16_2]
MENNETNTSDLNFDNRIPLEDLKNAVDAIKAELAKVIIGQENFIELLIVSLLVDGHVLIEGVPGIAKTVTAKLFAKTLKTNFSRIQFTPDLMPSDILGTSIFNVKTAEFEFKKGPIFSNIVLIDEINRAPAKTQAAMFEIMEEIQVTMDGTTYKIDAPFMVLATQNPIEQEGTYALPEAQLDRFLFKIKVEYPTLEEEVKIIQTHHERKGSKPQGLINAVITPTQLIDFKQKIQEIVVEEKIIKYIAEVISKTRNHPHLYLGGSPRASIATLNAAKAFAAIDGRDFVIPNDIKRALVPVLNHRVILTPEREMEGMSTDSVIKMIMESVEIPR